MRGFLLGASLSVVFIVGCVAGAAGRPIVVPEASARQPVRDQRSAQNPRWEYRCVRDAPVSLIQDRANRVGADGWELVTGSAAGWCFKRAL